MYIHIGNDAVVNTKHIVGIFDVENTTVSRLGKNFLGEAQQKGNVVYATEDFPKSYVVTKIKDKITVYISSMSTQVLSKRAKMSTMTTNID